VPTDKVVLSGEKLGGTSGETAPTQPLSVTVGGKTVTTDDWTETIWWTGKVTLRAVIKAGDTD